jgi:hypothetical protein
MDSVESQLPRIDSIFIHIGGPQAHVNSRKCQTATATPAKPGVLLYGIAFDFCLLALTLILVPSMAI